MKEAKAVEARQRGDYYYIALYRIALCHTVPCYAVRIVVCCCAHHTIVPSSA